MATGVVLNPRQHVGLARLVELAELGNSSLGPYKRYKFVHDAASGESALVCSCFRLLENMDLTCAVSQLLCETTQAQQKVYKTGSGCLLFLAGAWSRTALECLGRGTPVSRVVSAMSEGLAVCADVCEKCSVTIEGLGAADVYTATSPGCGCQTLTEDSKAPNPGMTSHGPPVRRHRKLKLCRHFYETENVAEETRPPQSAPPDIAHIAEGLSHGCADIMNLVVEVYKVQSKDVSCSTLDLNKVMTCVVPGLAEERAHVLPGCVFLIPADQASIARHFKDRWLKFVLIHGDLSHTFRHLGFKRPAGVQHVSDQPATRSGKEVEEEEEWLAKVVALLLSLEVNLVLVSGRASERVAQHCCRHGVLLVEKVKPSILRTLAEAVGCVPVSYATQLTKHCVGAGAKVEVREDLGGAEKKRLTAVSVCTGESGGLVTVVLTSFVQGKLQALEDRFWACAHRLHQALMDGVVLPGAGATEMLCIQHLLRRADNCGPADLDRGAVWRLMAHAFMDFVSTVMVNTGRFSKVKAWTLVSQHLQDQDGHSEVGAKFGHWVLSEGENEDVPLAAVVYDNLSVKQEVWRKALDLVLLVLQTDAEVVTGIDPKTAAQQNLILL